MLQHSRRRYSSCGGPEEFIDIYPLYAVSLEPLCTRNPRVCVPKHTHQWTTRHKSMEYLTISLTASYTCRTFLLPSLYKVAPVCPAHEESFTSYTIFRKQGIKNTSILKTSSLLLYEL